MKNKLNFLPLLFISFMSACATHGGNYSSANQNENVVMATDTTNQLITLFPPASSRLKLTQAINDEFGKTLINQLHGAGYAVIEKHSSLTTTETQAEQGGTQFTYTVGEIKNTNDKKDFYIVVRVGDKQLSRVYASAGNSVSPVGAWVHKE